MAYDVLVSRHPGGTPMTLRMQVVLFAAVAIGLVVGLSALGVELSLIGVALLAALVLFIVWPMYRQLRHLKVEAEAAERDARIYNARLEETVHTRTAELEAANVQLADSLSQLKATQARLLFAD